MREIKFRQPIYENGKFVRWHYWGFNGSYQFTINQNESQEFTGALDIKGTEIYEGDSIQWTDRSYPMDVDGWGRDMNTPGFKGDNPQIDTNVGVVYYDCEKAKFMITDWSRGRPLYDVLGDRRQGLVIGNKFETPELI